MILIFFQIETHASVIAPTPYCRALLWCLFWWNAPEYWRLRRTRSASLPWIPKRQSPEHPGTPSPSKTSCSECNRCETSVVCRSFVASPSTIEHIRWIVDKCERGTMPQWSIGSEISDLRSWHPAETDWNSWRSPHWMTICASWTKLIQLMEELECFTKALLMTAQNINRVLYKSLS